MSDPSSPRQIDRLGMLTCGMLVFGVINGAIQTEVSHKTLASWPVFFPYLLANAAGAITAFGLLCYYINHLYSPKSRVTGITRLMWLFALLLGNFLVMPIYWYLHLVNQARGPAPSAQGG
jgi:hypothetical protein